MNCLNNLIWKIRKWPYLSKEEKKRRIRRRVVLFVFPKIDKFRYKIVDIKNRVRASKYECYLCKNRFYSYYPFDLTYIKIREVESGNKRKKRALAQYRCPYCNSLNRKRMMFAYLEPFMDGFEDILYCSASSSGLEYVKKRLPLANIVTNDKYVDAYDFNYDIENMDGFDNEIFDLVICSHVLEHVHNDENAIKEMYRVLRVGGMIVIIVPLMLEGDIIDEDTTLSSKENWIRFGDSSHVRAYSRTGMFNRIKNLGLEVEEIDKGFFPKEIQDKNAMLDSDCIFIIRKEYKMQNVTLRAEETAY